MTLTFGFQLQELLTDPEYENLAPTYEFRMSYEVDGIDSMAAILLEGAGEVNGKFRNLKNNEIM